MKKKTMQSIITKYVVSLLLLIVGLVSAVFGALQYNTYREMAIDNLSSACLSVGENIDLQLNQLDTVVLGAINAVELTNTLEKYAQAESNSYEHLVLRQRLSSLLTSLKGFDYSIRQLNIYSIDGVGAGVGDYIGEYDNYLDDEWYNETLNQAGRKYIPYIDSENDYFSICRAYYDTYHSIRGIVEGRKYYSEIFHAATHLATQYDATVVIYDEHGDVIYPVNTDKEIFNYNDYYSVSPVEIANSLTGNKEIVAFYKMSHSRFVMAMAVETKTFMRPVFAALFPIAAIFMAASVAGSFIAFYISKGIATPIQQIYAFISFKGIFKSARLDMKPTGILEVDQLTDSINEYIAKSEEQTQKIVSLHEQEIQAQMLALQSQMNPHFLYNSLASIAEMAREGETDHVKTMTVNISQILRYISSNREQVTSIEEELELCDMYLECMSLRFGDKLEYVFDVEDVMLDYMIPKLCIQLLVENAIKSVTTQSPPWKIRVYGYTEGENWYVEVQDNGPGWDPEVDKKLRSQMDEILETRTLPSLKIEGMGVLNIFIRFYLLDGIKFLFDFGNREEGGAFVKVGRKIPIKEYIPEELKRKVAVYESENADVIVENIEE